MNPLKLKFEQNKSKFAKHAERIIMVQMSPWTCVAQPETLMVSNLVTGMQFLGKESNSHYNVHTRCLRRQTARSWEGGLGYARLCKVV